MFDPPNDRLRAPWAGPLAGLLLGVLPCHVPADELRLGIGAEFTSGTYGGDESVSQLYFPLTASYRYEHWGVAVTVPYLRVSTPSGSMFSDSGSGQGFLDEGLGDIVISAAYFDLLPKSDVIADLALELKLGTADREIFLGTGEDDTTLLLDLARPIGRWTPFSSLGYRRVGDSATVNYRDGWQGLVGVDYQRLNGQAIGVSYYGSEPSSVGSDGASELTVSASVQVKENLRLGTYVILGLSDASPDWGLGISLNSFRDPLHHHYPRLPK